jgi:hypothetical protein
MKRWKLFLISVQTVLMAGCASGLKIQTDINPEARFSNYKTFRFQEEESYIGPNFTLTETDREKVKAVIMQQMKNRNYIYSHDADLLIDIQGRIGMVQDRVTTNYPVRDWYGRYYPGWMVTGDEYRMSNETTLIINFLDASRKMLVWQGVATGKINKKKKNEEDPVMYIVNKIFQEYPQKNESPVTEGYTN